MIIEFKMIHILTTPINLISNVDVNFLVPDNLSKEKRSRVMASIRGKNTKPELIIRKLLWSMGKRYRIHDKSVYGTPDISHKTKRVAIFIDGCFWHGCRKCYIQPKTNTVFWKKKIERNHKRRADVKHDLKRKNWKILPFWEHEVYKNPQKVVNEIALWL